MSEITFKVQRLSNEPGKYIVTPWLAEPKTEPPFGLISPAQAFCGSEEEARQYLAGKEQSASQIQSLIKRANDTPEINAPEYIVTHTLHVS